MKRLFVIVACAALLMACGGNKAQNNECGECKTECSEKKECNKECEKQECEKKECEKNCDKKCDKQECTEQAAGCITINGEEFAKLVADLSQPEWKYLGDKPAVVDFYADWCGPCRAIAPFLEEIAKEYADQLYIYKINVDNDPEIANAFNIVGIPTLLFIPMEGRYAVKSGSMPKEELVKLITENCFK